MSQTKESVGVEQGQGAGIYPQAGRSRMVVGLFVAMTMLIVAGDLVVKYVSFRMVANVPVKLDVKHPETQQIPPHEPVALLPGLLHLKLTTNTGAVFGLGQGMRWGFVLVSVLAIGLIGLIFARSHVRNWPLHLGLVLILGGALGNLYDRFRYSAVRDMFLMLPEVHLPFGLSWPGGQTEVWPWIFNLADVALVVGVILVIGTMWYREKGIPRCVV